MIHRVCDPNDPAFDPKETHPCWNDKGKCSKRFPFAFQKETTCPPNSFAQTRRRSPEDGGKRFKWTKKDGTTCYIDNRSVVRHCPALLLKYNCHLNVEVSGRVDSVKYICKYFTKGHDMSCFEEKYPDNEIAQYKHGRFITAYEAHWDLYALKKHDCDPSVQRLALHLPNMQPILHEDWRSMPMDKVEHYKRTSLTSYFEVNADKELIAKLPVDPRTVPYQDFPKYFTWNTRDRAFRPRKRGFQLGRILTCNFRDTERWALRKLLLTCTGFPSYEAVRTVPTDEDINFLFDDDGWDDAAAVNPQMFSTDCKVDPEPDSPRFSPPKFDSCSEAGTADFEPDMELDLDLGLHLDNLNINASSQHSDLEDHDNDSSVPAAQCMWLY